jgi:hypothetical protein
LWLIASPPQRLEEARLYRTIHAITILKWQSSAVPLSSACGLWPNMFHSPKRLRGSGVGHGLLCSKSSAILGLVALGGVLMYLFQRHGLTTSSTATSRHSRLITVGGGNGEPGSHSCKNLCTEAGSGHFSSNTDTPCKWHGWFVHAHAVAPYKDKQFALMVRSYYRDAKQLVCEGLNLHHCSAWP